MIFVIRKLNKNVFSLNVGLFLYLSPHKYVILTNLRCFITLMTTCTVPSPAFIALAIEQVRHTGLPLTPALHKPKSIADALTSFMLQTTS